MSTVSDPRTLFDQVVRITHVYLGPAADRFIVRQIRNHLGKEPEDLEPEDLEKLIDWIRIAVSFLTDDSDLIEEYTDELRRLSRDRSQSPS